MGSGVCCQCYGSSITLHWLEKNLAPCSVIINMVSTDGQRGSFSSMSYAASKAALINLTDSLAINFGYDEKNTSYSGMSWLGKDF